MWVAHCQRHLDQHAAGCVLALFPAVVGMSLDYSVSYKLSREGSPFSNGTEGYGWMANWCDRCTRDAPFRNGISSQGCPLLLIALSERTPAEWLDGPRDEHGRYSIADQYTCIEFRAPGSGGGEPRPQPEPPDMDGLFPRPERSTRMFVEQPVQDALRLARPVVTVRAEAYL